jgi:GDP-L-fucose synthase
LKVCILGSNGLAGSGIIKKLERNGSFEIFAPSSKILDLKDRLATFDYLQKTKPDQIIMAAGVVGGIEYNKLNQISQFKSNRDISLNAIESAIELRIKNLLLLSSSCIYPRQAKIPIRESALFTGLPEKTNEGYSIAKEMAARLVILARNELSLNWSVVIPTNLYGYSSKFANDTHVIPMLLKKFHARPNVIDIWGDGSPIRQFLNNSDLGSAIEFLIERENIPPILNVAPKNNISISDLVYLIADIFRYKGNIFFDSKKDNGHPDKTLNTVQINDLGWYDSINLRDGLISLARESKLLVG